MPPSLETPEPFISHLWCSQRCACGQIKVGQKEKKTICFLPSHMKTPPFPEETIRGRNLRWLSKQIMFRNTIILNCDLRQQQKPPQPHFRDIRRLKRRQLQYNNAPLYNHVTNGGRGPYHRTFIFHRRCDKASTCSPSTTAFIFQRGGVKADNSLMLKQEGSLFPPLLYPRKWKAGSPVKQFVGAAHKLHRWDWVSLSSVRSAPDWKV